MRPSICPRNVLEVSAHAVSGKNWSERRKTIVVGNSTVCVCVCVCMCACACVLTSIYMLLHLQVLKKISKYLLLEDNTDLY